MSRLSAQHCSEELLGVLAIAGLQRRHRALKGGIVGVGGRHCLPRCR
jgi:hypothetical protein